MAIFLGVIFKILIGFGGNCNKLLQSSIESELKLIVTSVNSKH